MNFDITIFEVDKNKNLVNLTKIATAFGKLVANYLKAKSTQEFLEAFKDAYPDIPNGITVIQGGSGEQGTWAHREIALDFAQWISPKFKMFCIKQLDELFQTGKVSLAKPTTAVVPFAIPTNMKEALLLAYNQACDIEAQSVTIAALKPKADYTDEVLSSASEWTTTTIAKELGMSPQKLNSELYRLGVQYENTDGCWVLYAKYDGKDYAKTRTYTFLSKDVMRTKIYLVWTEKGRNYIHQVVANRNKVAANSQTEMPLRMAQ